MTWSKRSSWQGKKKAGASHNQTLRHGYDSHNQFSVEPIDYNGHMAQPKSKRMKKYISLVCREHKRKLISETTRHLY